MNISSDSEFESYDNEHTSLQTETGDNSENGYTDGHFEWTRNFSDANIPLYEGKFYFFSP